MLELLLLATFKKISAPSVSNNLTHGKKRQPEILPLRQPLPQLLLSAVLCMTSSSYLLFYLVQ